MARRDVDLVIRARDEAKGALDSISRALDVFVSAQRETQTEAKKTDSQLARMGTALTALQRDLKGLTAGETVAQELERARTALERLEASTSGATGEAVGYRREAGKAAQSVAELRNESERLSASIVEQEGSLARARAAQKSLQKATTDGAKAQERYSQQQDKLSARIATQEQNLAKYRERFRELQIAITQVAKPTAGLSRDFDRSVRSIQRTEGQLADLKETQRLVSAESDRAARSVRQANILYGQQAGSLGKVQKALAGLKKERVNNSDALRAAVREQTRLSGASDKAADALRRQDQALARARENYIGVEGAAKQVETALAGLGERIRGKLLRSFGEQRARLKATEQAFKENSREAQRYARVLRETEEPTRELQAAFESYREAAAHGRQEIRAQQRVLSELRGVLRESGGDVDSFTRRQQRFTAALERGKRGFSEYGRVSAAAVAARERLARADAQATQTTGNLTRATRNQARATTAAARSQGIFSDAIRRTYGESRVALSFTQRLRGEVLSLAAAYGGFYAVIDLVRNTVSSVQSLEAATNRLNVVFDRDQSAVAAELDFIRRNAARLGIEFGALSQEYTKFAIATQGTNLEGKETRRIFISVAEAARVNNLNLDQLKGTFTALTQIVSKGTLSAEELKQQLGDRLPGAIQIMADSLGVETRELIKMVEQGEVSSDALSKFATELDRRFGKQLPEALKSTTAAIGFFQNALFKTFLVIGKGGAIRGFTDLLRKLTDTLQSAQFQDFAARVGAALGAMFDILGEVIQNFDLLVIVATTFIGMKLAPFIVGSVVALRRLNAVLRLNRIRLASFRASMVAATGTLTGTAAAVARLRVALTMLLSSTGIGLLVTLIGTGIGLWITRTEEATEALIAHKEIMDKVRNAYDKTGDSVKEWREAVENLTITEAQNNIDQLEKRFSDLKEKVRDSIPRNLFGRALGSFDGRFRELDQIYKSFSDGEIQADDFLKKMDEVLVKLRELGDTYPDYARPGLLNPERLKPIIESTRELVDFVPELEDARNVLIALTGTLPEATKALRAANGEIEDTSSAAEEAERRLVEYREAMETLRGLVPSVAAEIKELDEKAKLEEAIAAAMEYADSWGAVSAALELYEKAFTELSAAQFVSSLSGVGGGAVGLSAQVIRAFERFQETPSIRQGSSTIGYGSNTVTLADGTIKQVTDGMRITRADADRDLVRRITQEFLPGVRDAVGAERFDGLDPRQQAALISLASRDGIGSLGEGGSLAGVTQAVREGSTEGVVQAIQALGASSKQAALFASGGTIDQSGFVAASIAAQKLAEDEAKARQAAREATLATIEQQQFQIEQQKLINSGKEREAAIQEAIRAAKEQNANITEEELKQISEQAGKLFDLANGDKLRNLEKERAVAAEERVNALLTLRQQLEKELETAQSSGASEEALQGVRDQMERVNGLLREAIKNALAFAVAMGSSDPQIQTLISRLRQLQNEMENNGQAGRQVQLTYEQLEKALQGSLVNAVNRFSESLSEGKNVIQSLGEAFRQFAADFLRQISQMILQQLALNAAKAVLGSFGYTPGSAVVFHSGGIVGTKSPSRQVDPSVFLGAVRYHSGGIAGLRPGEVPAILERGEEVLTAADPRHQLNLRGGSSTPGKGVQVRVINAVNAAGMLQEALAVPDGVEAILNLIDSNADSVRAVLEK